MKYYGITQLSRVDIDVCKHDAQPKGIEKLIKIPKDTDLKTAALAEPLAVAVNICRRAAFMPGDKTAVIGAGPIGLLTIALANQVYGVSDITAVDLSGDRLSLAKKLKRSINRTRKSVSPR